MDPAACTRLGQHIGSGFENLTGDFLDSFDRTGSAGRGGHVGFAAQDPS
jgi:hypothetical protein